MEWEAYAIDYDRHINVRAETARLAAEQAADDLCSYREVTYDGEEFDIQVRPSLGGEWAYFRVTAAVRFTFVASALPDPPEERFA